jgi:hypothetical protein
VRLRKNLSKKGLDAGAETIRTHLQTTGVDRVPSTSTIWRILTRRGFVTAQPKKRPKGAGKRFCADMPNERWQADTTHWQLAAVAASPSRSSSTSSVSGCTTPAPTTRRPAER